jgi:tetratricopeptide (TPR) repeat protein
MNSHFKAITDRVRFGARRDIQGWARGMELGASSIETYSPWTANEFTACSNKWQDLLKEIDSRLIEVEEIDYKEIDAILDILPPNHALYQFHLERLTERFDQLVLDSGSEMHNLFVQASASIESGATEIGFNVLGHILKTAPRYFPAQLYRGVLLLNSNVGREEAVRLFDKAANMPPQINTTRYKILALKLLAYAYELDGKEQNAIKTLKRISNIGYVHVSIDYNLARNYAISEQSDNMAISLESSVKKRPELLALPLIDTAFAPVKKDVLAILDEKNRKWGDQAVKLVDSAEMIVEISKDYELEIVNPDLQAGIDEYSEMKQLLESGCYSVYRELLTDRFPKWLYEYPVHAKRELKSIISTKLRDINAHNEAIMIRFIDRKKSFVRYGLPIFGFVDLLIFIRLLVIDVPLNAAFFIFLLILATGYIPLKILDRNTKRAFVKEKLDPTLTQEVKFDIQHIERTQKKLLIKWRSVGFEESWQQENLR